LPLDPGFPSMKASASSRDTGTFLTEDASLRDNEDS
jgi:hypothetical protein